MTKATSPTLSQRDLDAIVARLRMTGSDEETVEVKQAQNGTPNLVPTLCAFGNMPNGGMLILGLDERRGFTPTGLRPTQITDLRRGIASQARDCLEPPVRVEFIDGTVDGAAVLMGFVTPLSVTDKPCRVKAGGKAYLRQADGDYPMSEQEISQLVALRERPRHDVIAVPGTCLRDTDPDLVQAYLRRVRRSFRRFAEMSDAEVLIQTSVLATDGEQLTLAGLYAFGQHPQKDRPSLGVTARVRPGDRRAGRAIDLQHFKGPVPELLDGALEWVRRNTRTTIKFDTQGHGRDTYELPMTAIREIIGNAIVHRDLSELTSGKEVEIILTDTMLHVSNPGGLWGLNVEQLGKPGGKSAINEFLYQICQYVTTTDSVRVIEGEGGGIREANQLLDEWGLPDVFFIDTGVRFQADIRRPIVPSKTEALGLSRNAQILFEALTNTPLTGQQLADITGLNRSTVTRLAQQLRQAGLIEIHGGVGRKGTTYHHVG